MFQSPRMISYQVPDLGKASEWYSRLLGRDPAFESPMAVIFTVGDCVLALVPLGDSPKGNSGEVAFWSVDDIDDAYRRLIESGAAPLTEITLLMLKSRIARVTDPFGNVLGIICDSESKKSVEDRPSESALTVAYCRALATYDAREEVRGPDRLAEIFVAEEGKKSLKDPAAREWMIKRLCGSYEYFVARTAYMDQVVQQALRDDVPQIVMLGAGYDTRPYRFGSEIKGTRIFELDAHPTQQRKRRLLAQAYVPIPPQLVYVTINFEREQLAEVLARAGFDRKAKTLFVWEGVTYYLSPRAVDDTLAFIRNNSPSGSALCFDYMIQAPDLASRYGVSAVWEAWRKAYSSEQVRFGIEEGKVETFLSQRGFRLIENLAPDEIEKRFLTLKDGSPAGRAVALFNLAHASVSE